MSKIIKKVAGIVLIIGLLYGFRYAWQAFPIISGYGAKNLCTCVYVAGRTPESVLNDELGTVPLSLGSFAVNPEDSSASGSVFGMANKKAIYRKDIGCTLISELTEEEVRSQNIKLNPIDAPSDTLNWPLGTLKRDTVFQNINYDKLNKAVEDAFLENKSEFKINTRAVVVIYKGELIAEKYAKGFDQNTPQIGWSMTKSITSSMIGLMIKDGLIGINDDHLLEAWNNSDDPRSKITLDQLLRMSSGLEWEENYAGPSSATNMLFKKADMGDFASRQQLVHTPDTEWYYSSGTTNILSKIIHLKLGDSYHNYVRDRLFSPLKMSSAVIEPDASGNYVGSSYMYATPRDWARFGLLYLNDGVWNGKRILPEEWNDYVSTPTNDAPLGEYGAQFWLNAGAKDNPSNRVYPDVPTDVYSANGYEGQRVFIIPSKDMVVVRMGQTKSREAFDFNLFLSSIINSVE